MNGIHARITPTVADGKINVKIEWVEILDGNILSVMGTEEFNVSLERQGCSYITQIVTHDIYQSPVNFWMDEKGLRHFVMQAEKGVFETKGKEVGSSAKESVS